MAEVTSEQMERLVSALSTHFENNWDQVAPGEAKPAPEQLKARSRQFAQWYAEKAVSGDKSIYAGTKPFAEYAVKGNGALNAQVAKKAAGHYANFKSAHPTPAPVIAGPAGDVATHALEEGGVESGVEGEQAQPREDAVTTAEPKAEEAPKPTAETGAAAAAAVETAEASKPETVEPTVAETTPETETPAQTAPANDTAEEEAADGQQPQQAQQDPDAGQPRIHAPVTDETRPANYALADFDWNGQKSIYKPFSLGPEGERGNGSALKNETRNLTNEEFFPLDYAMMRTMAVYYGGYERDIRFQKGVEEFAQKYGKQVEYLFDSSKQDELYDWGNGEQLNAQKSIHKIYEQKSLLMGNPLEDDDATKQFDSPLTGVGYLKKSDSLLKRTVPLLFDKNLVVNSKHILNETGNSQLAFGSIVVFQDKQRSLYGDNGEKVFMKLGEGQKFRAEHAINMSRIYLSARQRPTEDGSRQHVKFSINSGVSLTSRALTLGMNEAKKAKHRDMMILGALHQGKRAGMAPDIYIKGPFGEKPRGEIKLEELSRAAITEFEQLGIDVGALITYNNDNVKGLDKEMSIEGEDAAPRYDAKPTPQEPGPAEPDAAATPAQPPQSAAQATGGSEASIIDTDARLTEQAPPEPEDVVAATPALNMSDIGHTPHSELAEQLMGKPLPKEEDLSPDQKADLAEFNAATREAQVGARLLSLARDPESEKASDAFMTPLSDDTDGVKQGISTHISAFNDVLSDKPLDEARRAELKTLGEERLQSAKDRFTALNQDEAAGKIAAVLPSADKDKGAQLKGSAPIILPTADAVAKPGTGVPTVPKLATALPVKRVDLGPAARTL